LLLKSARKFGSCTERDPTTNTTAGGGVFSGDEDQEFSDQPSNFAIYALNTIVEIDPDIVPFLSSPAPCAFERRRDDQPFLEARGFEFQAEEK
jgi:hypothetical protein